MAKETVLKRLGANVRRERTERQMSQTELAGRAGVHARTIAKIEAGELGIRPETIDRIQRAIGCSPEKILGQGPSGNILRPTRT